MRVTAAQHAAKVQDARRVRDPIENALADLLEGKPDGFIPSNDVFDALEGELGDRATCGSPRRRSASSRR